MLGPDIQPPQVTFCCNLQLIQPEITEDNLLNICLLLVNIKFTVIEPCYMSL